MELNAAEALSLSHAPSLAFAEGVSTCDKRQASNWCTTISADQACLLHVGQVPMLQMQDKADRHRTYWNTSNDACILSHSDPDAASEACAYGFGERPCSLRSGWCHAPGHGHKEGPVLLSKPSFPVMRIRG
mmetsp:Transcript_40952/g.88733  ORF Transcript_40952/g.88733 Transcript_40952/m.88733 type:complete len:131 (+) Transcript_40952:192-584(+)